MIDRCKERKKIMCSRGHWRPSEDEKLKDLVEQYGPHNWNAIALKLPGRSGNYLLGLIGRRAITKLGFERCIYWFKINYMLLYVQVRAVD